MNYTFDLYLIFYLTQGHKFYSSRVYIGDLYILTLVKIQSASDVSGITLTF